MKDFLEGLGIGIALVIPIILILYGFSWLLTCGIIKLICMCFGLTFSWGISTGIWLIICILKSIFTNNITVKKE